MESTNFNIVKNRSILEKEVILGNVGLSGSLLDKFLSIDSSGRIVFKSENDRSTFSSEVVLTVLNNPDADTDKFLVADSNGKIGFRTGTNLQSDLGVTPGTDVVNLVTIKSDLGDGARSSQTGQPNFTFQGGEGIDVTNSSDIFTVAGEDATDSNKGIARFNSANFSVTSGEVRIKPGGIDLTSEVTGNLPLTNGGTGASTAAGARTNLGVDAAGTDNSTDVTLAGNDYITISNQEITANDIDLTDDVTGTLPVANGGTGVTSLSELYSYQYLTWEVNTNSFTGTNYELPAANGGFGSDTYTTNSGVARNTAIDGSVTISLASNNQQQGWYVPHACELVGVSGLFRNNGSEVNPRDVAVFVGTPDIGNNVSSTYTQRAFAAGDDDGGQSNSRPYTTNVTLATPFSLVAGNVVMPAVCNSTGSSTVSMQGNFSIIIRTPIFM